MQNKRPQLISDILLKQIIQRITEDYKIPLKNEAERRRGERVTLTRWMLTKLLGMNVSWCMHPHV